MMTNWGVVPDVMTRPREKKQLVIVAHANFVNARGCPRGAEDAGRSLTVSAGEKNKRVQKSHLEDFKMDVSSYICPS
jgi:hypothetical protein